MRIGSRNQAHENERDTANGRRFPLRSMILLVLFILVLVAAFVLPGHAQVSTIQDPTAVVPHMIHFRGMLGGTSASSRTVGITFSLYKDQLGGSPLWQEIQNVIADSTGHYTVQLGVTTASGLPSGLFASAEARWIVS